MDSYEFNVCIERHEGSWTYTIAQEFDEKEAEILTFGIAENPELAIELAMLEMKTLL